MSLQHHLENNRGATMPLPAWLYVRGFERPLDLRMVTHGSGQTIARTPIRRAIRGTLEGTLIGTDYDNAITELDALLDFLNWTPIKLRQQGPTARYLEVYPELVDDTRTNLAHRRALQIPLIAPNPWWVGAHGTFTATTTGTVEHTIVYNGSAPAPATITLENGTATNPVLTNAANNHTLLYGDALGAADVLIADGYRRTLTLNGANDLGKAGDAFITYGFWLLPGTNPVELNTGGGSIDLTVEWTERFW